MYSFPDMEPVSCSMSSSNCCFLTSQEASQVVWYSHLFQNFPQFIVIHTVKGFDRVNKAEIHVFLELSCFFNDPSDVGNLISGSSVFSKTSLNIWKWEILKEMGIPDHLTCHLTHLYAEQEATVRTRQRTTDWFQIETGVQQDCILLPCLFHLYAE